MPREALSFICYFCGMVAHSALSRGCTCGCKWQPTCWVASAGRCVSSAAIHQRLYGPNVSGHEVAVILPATGWHLVPVQGSSRLGSARWTPALPAPAARSRAKADESSSLAHLQELLRSHSSQVHAGTARLISQPAQQCATTRSACAFGALHVSRAVGRRGRPL